MILWKTALVGLLFCNSSLAAPKIHQKVYTNNERRAAPSSIPDAPTAVLEPVNPDGVNRGDITNLDLDKAVTLAWAGSSAATTARRLARRDGPGSSHTPLLKRDSAIYSSADWTFQYPIVALDQSSYVSNIKCTSGTLTGTLTSSAYSYAKSRWAKGGNIIFLTAVDGCGTDDENHLFLATLVTFSDITKSFSAKGAKTSYKAVGDRMKLRWGNVPANTKIKRAADNSEMFKTYRMDRRRTGITIPINLLFSMFESVDKFAPWDNAVQLFNWTKSGGKEDNKWSKGELKGSTDHSKRSSETSLAIRDSGELQVRQKSSIKSKYEFGLAVYCVECGFVASATIWGELDYSAIDGVTSAKAGFDASFGITMNVGFAAYVMYKKEWYKRLARAPLVKFGIPLIADVGPFVELGLKGELLISATGTFLAGGGFHYDQVGYTIDFLDPGASHAVFTKPRYEKRVEASGQLSMEASVGLPLKLGLGVQVLLGVWEAEVAVVETPSLGVEGVFEVGATLTDDGTWVTDINGGCYGIAWSLFFKNTVELELKADWIGQKTINLLTPFKSDPLAADCIGYVKDGSEGQELTNSGAGGNGLGGGNGISGNQPGSNPSGAASGASPSATSSSGCRPGQVVDNFAAATGVCKKITRQASVTASNNVGKGMILNDIQSCADACLKEPKCVSFSLSDKGVGGYGTCQMYTKKTSSLPIMTKNGNPTLTFYDKDCWKYSKCR